MILNDLIFQHLQEFLGYPNIDVNNLLNVCRKFKNIKKELFYQKLNKKFSAEYYHNSTGFVDQQYRNTAIINIIE